MVVLLCMAGNSVVEVTEDSFGRSGSREMMWDATEGHNDGERRGKRCRRHVFNVNELDVRESATILVKDTLIFHIRY